MADTPSPPEPGAAPPEAGAPPLALYANQFEVGYNAFEFLLHFGQHFDDDLESADGAPEPPKVLQTRVVMPPVYAKVLLAVLARSVAAYEACFGPLEVPPGDEGA